MDGIFATDFTNGANFLTTDHSPLTTVFEGDTMGRGAPSRMKISSQISQIKQMAQICYVDGSFTNHSPLITVFEGVWL